MSAVAPVIARAKAMATRKAEDRRISSIGAEHEPGPANIGDQRRAAAEVYLAPQVADMDVDDIGFRRKPVVPNPFEQHGARNELTGAAHEIFEELEFARQQIDLDLAAPHGLL